MMLRDVVVVIVVIRDDNALIVHKVLLQALHDHAAADVVLYTLLLLLHGTVFVTLCFFLDGLYFRLDHTNIDGKLLDFPVFHSYSLVHL